MNQFKNVESALSSISATLDGLNQFDHASIHDKHGSENKTDFSQLLYKDNYQDTMKGLK